MRARSPNTSSAVMQQRKEARDALDDFPTPPWATRALCEWLLANALDHNALGGMVARDPCANRGYMVAPLAEYFGKVEASDVHDYGAGFLVEDYLFGPPPHPADITFMNPPFRLAEQFILRARSTSRQGVAALVRSAFLEGIGRHERLFSKDPPSVILQFTERVVMHKGCVTEKGSSATAYSWLYWDQDGIGKGNPPEFHWLPQCRKRLERQGDYDVRGAHAD